MLFDDVLDANRRLHLQPCGLGILRKQAAAVTAACSGSHFQADLYALVC